MYLTALGSFTNKGRGRGTVAESSNSKRGFGVGEEVLGSIPG